MLAASCAIGDPAPACSVYCSTPSLPAVAAWAAAAAAMVAAAVVVLAALVRK
mgnify:CR=1 FL=1